MKYRKTITLKDGRICILRNGTEKDGKAVLDNFILTHKQTDNLLSYPDESDITAEQEAQFLKSKSESACEIEILAEADGVVAGLAGIDQVGSKYKVRHRADFGISADQAYWGLGIGWALLEACIECAEKAGYEQMELSVVAENSRVIEYASRALSLEPGIQDVYYWISIAAEATGNSMMKDRYNQMAREELPEEEYQKVQHLLEIRTHTTE